MEVIGCSVELNDEEVLLQKVFKCDFQVDERDLKKCVSL